MNHSSNEVKQLVSRVCSYLARRHDRKTFTPELLKVTLPMLVNGTKEKNSYVKADSEIALVSVLRLRQGEEMLQVSKQTQSNFFKVYLIFIFNLGNAFFSVLFEST